MIKWLKDKWTKFGDWVQSWFPCWKTKATLALGALGSAALVLQQYVTAIPPNKFINETQLAIANFILFSLAFWFKRISDRAED